VDRDNRLLPTDFDLDGPGGLVAWRLHAHRQQGSCRAFRRHAASIALNADRDVISLPISMRLDPTAQEIGVQSVGQRNRRNRYARLQAGGNYLCLEFRCVPPIPPGCRRRKYICVHVSTKNIVDTIVASGQKLSKMEGLDAYNVSWISLV
jgi:hypothetical protein